MTSLKYDPEIEQRSSDCNVQVSASINTSPSSVRNHDAIQKHYDAIPKSPNDKRAYRGLVLNNEMKIVLVSDPTTDKSAAAIGVEVGSMSEPSELPGLAHFCEHMLFLGTKKFPVINEYMQFVLQHGGHCNAGTGMDYTEYYFNISPDKLDEVLERFAQFFLKPLFTESATDLERNAVNSEYENYLIDDGWRMSRLIKFLADHNHPYSRFSVGNKQTLDVSPKDKGIDVRKGLLDFYNTWYSSNIMMLSVLGKDSLDELEKMVVSRFADVENKKVEMPTWPEHPYKDEHFRTKCFVVPVNDERFMKIIFPLPDLREHFRFHPASYVARLLGYEGAGSVLSALKKLGWSDWLYTSDECAARGDCNFFNIDLGLTEEGIKHTDDIITLLFQYINLMKKEQPIEWIFEDEFPQELAKMSKINFNYQQKDSPTDCVRSIIDSLRLCPIEEVRTAPFLFTNWQPDLINLVVNHLKPENIRVFISGKIFENIAMESEPIFKIKFKKEKITQEIIEKWENSGLNTELAYPTRNEFIPENFVIKAQKMAIDEKPIEKFPVIIEDSSLMRIWFKQDDEYLLPQVIMKFAFTSPVAYSDPVNALFTELYIRFIRHYLNESTYSAKLAYLNWNMDCERHGIVLEICGYHDKHRILLDKILDKMVNFTIDAKRFEILKEGLMREVSNRKTWPPHSIACHYLGILLDHYWETEDSLKVFSDLTIEGLNEFVKQFLTKIHVESLIYGNLTKSEALETARLVESKLTKPTRDNVKRCVIPLLPIHLLPYRQVSLDNGSHFLYQVDNKSNKSSCTQIYYQTEIPSTESNVRLLLLLQIMTEPCFNILRTTEQLGYIVRSKAYFNSGVQGLLIIVQSHRHPNYVDKRIELFIESMLELIENMSDEEFSKHKASLAVKILEKPKNMPRCFAEFWGEIHAKEYNFDRATVAVAYLKTLAKDQILQYYKEFIYKKSATRKKLAIHILSIMEDGAGIVEPEQANNTEGLAETPIKIEDILAFKMSQSLSSLPNTINDISKIGQRSKF